MPDSKGGVATDNYARWNSAIRGYQESTCFCIASPYTNAPLLLSAPESLGANQVAVYSGGKVHRRIRLDNVIPATQSLAPLFSDLFIFTTLPVLQLTLFFVNLRILWRRSASGSTYHGVRRSTEVHAMRDSRVSRRTSDWPGSKGGSIGRAGLEANARYTTRHASSARTVGSG